VDWGISEMQGNALCVIPCKLAVGAVVYHPMETQE
jgi:hypothetical protein